jgi:hypothetical protein
MIRNAVALSPNFAAAHLVLAAVYGMQPMPAGKGGAGGALAAGCCPIALVRAGSRLLSTWPAYAAPAETYL